MKCYLKTTIVIFLAILFLSTMVYAHAGHDDAPGENEREISSGPIIITDQAKRNLGLVVQESEIRTIDKILAVIGQIEPVPSKLAVISSRISGRVAAIYALDGSSVKKGDALVDVESRQVGDPPPHVKYVSPIDGLIIDRHTSQGDAVEPDKHLMEVADLSEVFAEGRIYEGQVSLIQKGQTVRVVVESYPSQIFTGKIELIDGALDPETRTLKIWVRMSNPDLKLRPNMRATLYIVTAQSESVIAVPKSSVLGEAGNYFVFIQNDTEPLNFERRAIVTGINDDQFIEIAEGVFPGDKVVTVGNYQLQYLSSKKEETHK